MGLSEGAEEESILVLGLRVGPTLGASVLVEKLSQVHPQVLKPIEKSCAYDTVSGSSRTSWMLSKYSVLIPSMNDRCGMSASRPSLISI